MITVAATANFQADPQVWHSAITIKLFIYYQSKKLHRFILGSGYFDINGLLPSETILL